jgi:hypothetical protein
MKRLLMALCALALQPGFVWAGWNGVFQVALYQRDKPGAHVATTSPVQNWMQRCAPVSVIKCQRSGDVPPGALGGGVNSGPGPLTGGVIPGLAPSSATVLEGDLSFRVYKFTARGWEFQETVIVPRDPGTDRNLDWRNYDAVLGALETGQNSINPSLIGTPYFVQLQSVGGFLAGAGPFSGRYWRPIWQLPGGADEAALRQWNQWAREHPDQAAKVDVGYDALKRWAQGIMRGEGVVEPHRAGGGHVGSRPQGFPQSISRPANP